MPDRYLHGHHESVRASHRWRTAENSAAYLLPHLTAGIDLLDVGCGVGTITADLAALVTPGRVAAIDTTDAIVAEARAATDHLDNVTVSTGDVYHLGFADESFDVVHAHQVLQHLADPVAALTECRRVLRPGGRLAVRDGDYGAFVWAPGDARLDRWNELIHAVATHNGADADAGRSLPAWVRAAGFDDVDVSSSTWTFSEPADRQWWGSTWAQRCEQSAFAEQAVAAGLTTTGELAELAAAFTAWIDEPAAVFVVVHVEVLARAGGGV